MVTFLGAAPLAGQTKPPAPSPPRAATAPPDSFTDLGAALRSPLQVRSLTLRDRSGPLPPRIGTLVNLEVLVLDRTDLASLPATLGRLRHLRVLYLGGNPRLDFAKVMTQLAAYPALERLGLDDNGLTALPPEIGMLVRLRALSLSKNQLRSLPPEIGRMTALRSLDLVQNEFFDLPEALARLPSLRTVYVSGNVVSSEAARRFQRKAPRVSVTWRVPDEPYFH